MKLYSTKTFLKKLQSISLIICCLTTTSISVWWNGEITEKFLPFWGIRQGDPLSPYIFVLCLEWLSSMIKEKVSNGLWKPVKITHSIAMSHLLISVQMNSSILGRLILLPYILSWRLWANLVRSLDFILIISSLVSSSLLKCVT